MENKKKLTRVQVYAVTAATVKTKKANNELESLLRDVAIELGIDMDGPKGGRWRISEDSKYLERLDIPEGKKKG